jgi:hypothetical protein
LERKERGRFVVGLKEITSKWLEPNTTTGAEPCWSKPGGRAVASSPKHKAEVPPRDVFERLGPCDGGPNDVNTSEKCPLAWIRSYDAARNTQIRDVVRDGTRGSRQRAAIASCAGRGRLRRRGHDDVTWALQHAALSKICDVAHPAVSHPTLTQRDVKTLDRASIDLDIVPFARLVGERVRWSNRRSRSSGSCKSWNGRGHSSSPRASP